MIHNLIKPGTAAMKRHSLNFKHRVLFVVGQLGGGGLERQLYYLLSAMDRDKFRPGVAVWNFNANDLYVQRISELGANLYPIERTGTALARLVRLGQLVRQTRPEVLHSYSFHTNFPAWFAMRGLDGLTIGSFRNDYYAEAKEAGSLRAFLSTLFPRAFIANSLNALRQAQAEKSRVASKKVFFVPNAVDLSLYPHVPLPEPIPFVMVGIGRLAPQKSWETVLLALARFAKVFRSPWQVRVCGNGPLKGDLQQLAENLSVASHVDFLGFRTDVADILSACHVFVSGAQYEGTPNALLEALAMGRPAVHTNVGDAGRLMTHGSEGFLVEPGDAEGMSECLLKLARDRSLLKRMSANARERMKRELNPEGLVRETFAVYRSLGWKG